MCHFLISSAGDVGLRDAEKHEVSFPDADLWTAPLVPTLLTPFSTRTRVGSRGVQHQHESGEWGVQHPHESGEWGVQLKCIISCFKESPDVGVEGWDVCSHASVCFSSLSPNSIVSRFTCTLTTAQCSTQTCRSAGEPQKSTVDCIPRPSALLLHSFNRSVGKTRPVTPVN